MVPLIISFVSFVLFLCFQAQGIQAGDSGDLVTAAATFGVAHPPGYPLFTFLGWVVSKIPFFTVAWRVALLSSLSHAMVIFVAYQITYFLTKRTIASVFTTVVLLGNYLFFLYSVTPEVFALLDLFIVVCMSLTFRWVETKDPKWLIALSFMFGLSLTHHHMILFLVPAICILLWGGRKKINLSRDFIVKAVGAFFLGLLPYVYVFIAAHMGSIINWDKAINISNFIRLITRADYGTFQSGAVIGALPIQRLLQIKIFLQYLVVDFTWLGVVGIMGGLYYLLTSRRNYFYFFIVAIMVMGPIFFAYASFPLSNRFTLATLERFLLPSYVLFSIVLGVGFSYLLTTAERLLKKKSYKHAAIMGACGLVFLFYFTVFGINLGKFWGYAQDRTAEHLAVDIMADLPPESILIMDRDTPLFTTQYMRYAQKFRSDVILLHGSRLSFDDYQSTVSEIFSSLSMPPAVGEAFVYDFLKHNIDKRNVFSYMKYKLEPGWYWVPHGFVYQLLPKDKLPTIGEMKQKNLSFWEAAHDPSVGVLSRYDHLMLSDVRDVYASARLEFGKIMLRAGDVETAKSQFERAIEYGGDAQAAEMHIYVGLSELFLSHCNEALANFQKAKSLSLSVNNDIIFYESQTHKDCTGDKKKAQELFDAYIKTQDAEKTPLKQL